MEGRNSGQANREVMKAAAGFTGERGVHVMKQAGGTEYLKGTRDKQIGKVMKAAVGSRLHRQVGCRCDEASQMD